MKQKEVSSFAEKSILPEQFTLCLSVLTHTMPLWTSLGPVHTGRRAPCNMCMQIMEHTAVNGSVHTGCKQHQRVCTQICMQICLRILCEQGLELLEKNLQKNLPIWRKKAAISHWNNTGSCLQLNLLRFFLCLLLWSKKQMARIDFFGGRDGVSLVYWDNISGGWVSMSFTRTTEGPYNLVTTSPNPHHRLFCHTIYQS